MSYENIIYGSLILIVLTQVLKLIPDLSWQVIFSSSIAYATYLSSTITAYLPKITPLRNKSVALTMELIEKGTEYALEIINQEGLTDKSLLLVTTDDFEKRPSPIAKLNDPYQYIIDTIKKEFKGRNVAVVMVDYYDWKRSWWSKTKHYSALDINVQITDESHSYEFCHIIEENKDGEYEIGEKGLIFLKKYRWNIY